MAIIRILHTTVYPGKEEAFRQFLMTTAMARLKAQKGIVSVSVGASQEDSPREFVTIMVWKDLDAIIAFAGERWREPILHLDEAHYVDEVNVQHYDLAWQEV